MSHKNIMIRVVQNFYDDPDEIVKNAFSLKYQLISNGNYPGKDSLNRMIVTPELEMKIRKFFPDAERFKITCSRFRYSIEGDTYMSFVHSDSWGRKSGWHILVYLSKAAPVLDGITLYETKEGQRHWKDPREDLELTDWIPWTHVNYEYNQAVILDYSYFHAPLNSGFGNSILNSRFLHIIEIVDTQSPSNKDRYPVLRVRMPGEHHPDGRDDDDETLSWSDSETAAYERIEYL
jgi:hypothetical protein